QSSRLLLCFKSLFQAERLSLMAERLRFHIRAIPLGRGAQLADSYFITSGYAFWISRDDFQKIVARRVRQNCQRFHTYATSAQIHTRELLTVRPIRHEHHFRAALFDLHESELSGAERDLVNVRLAPGQFAFYRRAHRKRLQIMRLLCRFSKSAE